MRVLVAAFLVVVVVVVAVVSPAAAFRAASPSPSFWSGNAFGGLHRRSRQPSSSSLLAVGAAASAPDADVEIMPGAAAQARKELLDLVVDLKAKHGLLLVDKAAQDAFKAAVAKLEAAADPPTDPAGLLGAWTLLCSTASSSSDNGAGAMVGGIDTSKIPFFNDGPVRDLRDTMNRALRVEQIVRSVASDGIDAIDHVIEYSPPDTLSSVWKGLPDSLPEYIRTLNINPLQVSETKVYLKHKAEVDCVIPTLRTKLSLSSIVVNVAGRSQNLDPAGGDVLGINVPFGEFLNAGSFDTTFMDDTVRISRSRVGIVDQVRLFIRTSEADSVAPYVVTSPPPAAAAVAAKAGSSDDYDDDDDELADDDGAVDAVVLVDDEGADSDGDDSVEAPSDVEEP